MTYFRRVTEPDQSKWRTESMLVMAGGLLVSLSVAGLVAHALTPPGQTVAETTDYLPAAASSIGFQLALLGFMNIFLMMNGLSWRTFLGVPFSSPGKTLLTTVIVTALFIPVAIGLVQLSIWLMTRAGITPQEQEMVRLILQTREWQPLLLLGGSAILLAPVMEELLFRGILYGFLAQRTPHWFALWMSALIFATAHVNLMTFMPLTLFGLFLVWLHQHTRTLVAPILAHSLFNLVNFLLLLFQDPVIAPPKPS